MRFYFLFVLTLLSLYQETLPSQELEDLISIKPNYECRVNHAHDTHDAWDIGQLEPVLSAECEPLTSVADCVNVVSGQFFQVEKDLVGHTIEPLDIVRFYDSSSPRTSLIGFGFGFQFPLWASDIQEGARHSYAMISERDGFWIPYQGYPGSDQAGRKHCHIDPRLTHKGYTNLSRASISGHSNFVNWKAIYRSKGHEEAGYWNIRLGDGTQRIYGKRVKMEKDQQIEMDFPTRHAHLLTKEIKPNGNQLVFSYDLI